MWNMHEGIGWWVIFRWIWFLAFFGGLVYLVVWIVRKTSDKSSAGTSSTPLDIARERYARGEISREEFEEIKKNIT